MCCCIKNKLIKHSCQSFHIQPSNCCYYLTPMASLVSNSNSTKSSSSSSSSTSFSSSSNNTQQQWELSSPPSDGVTSFKFSKVNNTSDSLLCSSWDGTVRMYHAKATTCIWKHTETFAEGDGTTAAAVLSACFGSSEQIAYAGGLNKAVSALSITPTGDVVSIAPPTVVPQIAGFCGQSRM